MRTYTGKEHIATAFRREYTDRVPVTAWYVKCWGLQAAGVTAREARTDPKKFAKAILKTHEMLPTDDYVLGCTDEALQAESFGKKLGATREMIRALHERNIPLLQDKSTFAQLEPPDLKNGERLPYYLELFNILGSELEAGVSAMGPGPWATAMGLRGTENVIYDLQDDPQFIRDLLGWAIEHSKRIGDAILETGIQTYFIGEPTSSCSVISPPIFKKWAKPALEEVIRHLKRQTRVPICMHICGYADPIMEDLLSLGLDGISIDSVSSLEKMITLSQRKTLVWGNADTYLFVVGTKEEMDEQIKKMLNVAAKGSAYVLCSGCGISESAPMENIRYFVEAGQKYGRYENLSFS